MGTKMATEPKCQWGQTHEGDRYNITIEFVQRDDYPNDFKRWVKIEDKHLHATGYVMGYGKFVGNFSPIWVRRCGHVFYNGDAPHKKPRRGEFVSLETLLREPLPTAVS